MSTIKAGTTSTTAYQVEADTTGNLVIATGTSANVAMTVNSSGNIGVGVTPSAWDSGKVIEVNQLGTAFWGNGVNNLWITSNAYYNGGNFKYGTGGGNLAGAYQMVVGQHRWYLAPAGTNAGDTITFTQAMTLDADGNLGVGTTSPDILSWNKAITLSGSGNTAYELAEGSTAKAYFGYDTVNDLGILAMYANEPLVFRTNNADRARITSGGYWKASNDGTYLNSTANYHEFRNTNSDWVVVCSNGSTGPSGYYIEYGNAAPNGTANHFFYAADTGAIRATIRSNGGLANYQNNDVNLSDERVKKDIKPIGSMWDKFKALEIVTFKYKDQTHDDDNIGVIAQQVESVAPEFVDNDGWGKNDSEDGVPLKSIYTADMYHASIKALQEAMARIEKLEAEVAALKAG